MRRRVVLLSLIFDNRSVTGRVPRRAAAAEAVPVQLYGTGYPVL